MLAGYCWPQSVRAKETITLYCHGEVGPVRAQVVRLGVGEQTVLEQSGIAVRPQPLDGDLAQHGCDWQPSFAFEVGADWPSGFYLVRLTHGSGDHAEAFFVVRAAEPGDALLVLSTSTWTAYNDWGGPSFYTGGQVGSLRRPLPPGFLEKSDLQRHRIARFRDWSKDERRAFAKTGYSPWCMAAGWANWERLFVAWAEAQGLRMGYATSADLDREAGLLDGYPCYLSVGHDEYWTAGMRDHVEAFIDNGGNAAFLSGNTAFWQARFEAERSRLVCCKTALEADPLHDPVHAPQLSTMWSDPLVGRPESLMTGVSFTRGGYAHMPNAPRGTGGYQVWQPDHWAFESLALEPGAPLGVNGLVVGYECDGCELVERAGVLRAADGGAPEGFQVLASAPARLWETQEAPDGLHESYIGELNWVAERLGGGDTAANRARFEKGHAVMGTFRRGKGEVFTTGCTDWAYGLQCDDVATVTRNLLRRFTRRGGTLL